MGLFGSFRSSGNDADSTDFRSEISGMDVVELGRYWTRNRSFSQRQNEQPLLRPCMIDWIEFHIRNWKIL